MSESEIVIKLSNVNGDEKVTIEDATLIQKYLAGYLSDTGNAGEHLPEI